MHMASLMLIVGFRQQLRAIDRILLATPLFDVNEGTFLLATIQFVISFNVIMTLSELIRFLTRHVISTRRWPYSALELESEHSIWMVLQYL